MTKHVKIFHLTGPVKRCLEAKHYTLKCYVCGNPIQCGEKLVSKRKIGNSRHKYYHYACWEALFIE